VAVVTRLQIAGCAGCLALAGCFGKIEEPRGAVGPATSVDGRIPPGMQPTAAGTSAAPSSTAPAEPGQNGTATSAGNRPSGDDVSDPFGVRKLNPTIPGGREWYLPSNADTPSKEWNVERNKVSKLSDGVFHTVGNNGEVRLSVASPAGVAWWRNVEMTGYFRYTGANDSNDQERHWELMARGERHSASGVTDTKINDGVAAPSGTLTWPGYPFKDASLNQHCLGTSYHGNFYLAGNALFEKEISHINGYANQRGEKKLASWPDPLQRWFGLKYVLRNADADRRVHLELWLDANGDGNWQQLAQTDDTPGSWKARMSDLDGCTDAPFSFQADQLMTWAGPWVIFRSDSMAIDFRALSAREIAPLP
jgi:hypothetical protein